MNKDPLFYLGDFPVIPLDLFWLGFSLVCLLIVYFAFNRFFIPFLDRKEHISTRTKHKGIFLLISLLILIYVEISFKVLSIQFQLFNRINLYLILEAMILLVLIYLILWIITNIFIHRYFQNREKEAPVPETPEQDPENSAVNSLRWLLFSVALLILFRYIDWDYILWTFKSPKADASDIHIRFSSILTTLIIFLVARLFLWVLTQLLLFRYYKRRQFDTGISYSINKLISYLVYFTATIFALRNLGMDMGLLLGGAAALLVGIGLALQGTFSDFFSGLILLFERPIKVGDFVSYDGKPVEVQKIGLRASKVIDRNSVNYIIPNSKLITQAVINLSHDEKSVRFQIYVGVAYGSDTALVEQLLMQAALEHKEVLKRPKPKVVFHDFGNSSLDFQLNYYSKNIFNAEWVKSDIRFTIDRLFREHKVTIPFPQRDVWMKNP